MRKQLFIPILLVLPFFLGAQTKNIQISWDSASRSKVGNQTQIGAKSQNDDSGDVLRLELGPLDPTYVTLWEETGMVDPNSVRITNINYGNLTREELDQIDVDLVPNQLKYSLQTTEAREKRYSILRISPVVRRNGNLQKILSFNVNYSQGNTGHRADPPQVMNSVLAEGQWYKFKVEKTGVHKIDRAFLQSLGMNTDGINPRNIKVYGHGGQSLPLLNARNHHFDLPETPIQVIGEEDGRFDSGDYILFYGTSTEGYVNDNDSHINPYSDESFYYITAHGGPGKRVQNMVEPSGNADHVFTRFHDYKFHEKDEENPTKLGRVWYGNRFDINREQSYDFSFPNIVSSEPMKVIIKTAAASESNTSMGVTVNGAPQNRINYSRLRSGILLSTRDFIENIPATTPDVNIKLTYNNSGNPSSVAYLDYIRVEAVRELRGVSGQLQFRNTDAANLSGIGEYRISNASQFSQVWDVTDPMFITSKSNSNNSGTIAFKQNLGSQREYVAVNPDDYYTPVKIHNSIVANQNIKGSIFRGEDGGFQDVDYVIITAPFLLQPALRLANHHKNTQGLNVKVVTTDKIYEEFSSGKQDIAAIRNFVRYVYYNASHPNNRIKYLGIFGDTSIDYKNRLANNNNIVPTFHTVINTNEANSFMSDDFFANVGPFEGTIGGNSYDENGNRKDDIDRLDIATGRIVVDNVVMANALVDKIINYMSKNSYGNWRTNLVLVSDDPDVQEEASLQSSLDLLGDQISSKKPYINVKKIHSDAYKQQTSAGGNRYPDVNKAIEDALDVGALVFNYFGHGGEDGLAHEAIYTKETAQELRNKDNLPCFVTVTCEFTKFDNPLRITAGELTFQNPDGGAISLITSTRSVYISVGIEFNKKLAPFMFGYDHDGQDDLIPEVPAEALRLAKNGIASQNRRAMFYVGDPAMPLAFPKKDIVITHLNEVPIEQSSDTLKALSRVKFAGEMRSSAGQPINDFNGTLEVKLFDKNVRRRTLDNDNNGVFMDFITLGEGLFNGKASIKNGKFEFEFIVPRDIQVPVGPGRLSLYARRDNAPEDRTGVNLDVQVGGIDKNAPEDNEGPKIRLFMNDESFVSGGITNHHPILIAKLEDESGINTASGIGHDLVAILDGDEANPIVLNEFYQTEVDDFTKGDVQYKLSDLSEGMHTLTLKAWDVYNNSSTAEIQFMVAGSDKLEITRVLNYPNPFVNYTEFWFNHNRPFEPLDVQVQVFTVSGKVVWTKNETITTDGFLSRDLVWDGRDDFGDRIGKGVYVYKITVKSTLTNQRVEKFEKLVIL